MRPNTGGTSDISAVNVKVSYDQTQTLNIFLLFLFKSSFFLFERPPLQSLTVKCRQALTVSCSCANWELVEFYSAGSSGDLKNKWYAEFLVADGQMFPSISQLYYQN